MPTVDREPMIIALWDVILRPEFALKSAMIMAVGV